MNFTLQGRLTVWDVPTVRALSGLERFMETFRIKAVPGDGICTLVLAGEADIAIAEEILKLGILSLSETATHALIVDLAAVSFIDSTAIGALVHLHNAANEQGKRLALVGVSARVRHVLAITGLDAVFDIAAS